MPTSLTHIAMHVQDLAACVDFYHRYAEMNIVHERPHHNGKVIWMAEHGREKEFILVLLPGGPGRAQSDSDFSHLGFAVASRHAVDSIADRARAEGILVWETREEDYPVGYYCGLRDPDGNFVEFSYGQPLGPGAENREF
ncbi:VOC family protein [Zhongshania sp.]|jgi:catechol 2,3-dioxygenase-like lactoylglutathione lyase family enzyme|uniref:VOC family protein n=1 Tax=Zhongshania sp. TaxID=1971902 RepID=UPI001B7563D9|nr:VOC family protein [Zhongshania sp.]MBQ0794570.1 VOC family protein [Zhongshania sp.]|tara:strand:- start:64 stop:483 length:420 start_codon:yes stop_codon:yes gene_type:complete